MSIVEISTNYIDLACECEGILADLEEIRIKVRKFRSKFTYQSNNVAIIDSYVIPYISGLMGEGQIMMSLADILKHLEEESVDTYVVEELGDYEIPDESEESLC